MSKVVELSNGVKVANFSSPHPFTFTDGTVLPAVSKEVSETLKVTFIETPTDNPRGFADVRLDFELSEAVMDQVGRWQVMFLNSEVDVVLCPLPMIQALKKYLSPSDMFDSPFRCVRMGDRIKKLAEIDKFTL